MYGYAFAAAELGLQHVVRKDILVYAGTTPLYEPSIIHYGLWCQAGERMFNKLSYKSKFDVHSCEQYFPEPPDLQLFLGKEPSAMAVELLCTEQIAVFNEALCEYHGRTCCNWEDVDFACYDQKPMPLLTTEEACRNRCCDRTGLCTHYVFDPTDSKGPCFHAKMVRGECREGEFKVENPNAKVQRKVAREVVCPAPSWNDVQRMQDEQNVLGGVYTCEDTDEACRAWAKSGECITNDGFMLSACPLSCRADGCIDTHISCDRWAESGQCDENFQYMVEHCPVACRKLREARAHPLKGAEEPQQQAADGEGTEVESDEPEELANEEPEEEPAQVDDDEDEEEDKDVNSKERVTVLFARTEAGRRLREARRNKPGYRPARIMNKAPAQHVAEKLQAAHARVRNHSRVSKESTSRKTTAPKEGESEEEDELDWVLIAVVCVMFAAIVALCVLRHRRRTEQRLIKNL